MTVAIPEGVAMAREASAAKSARAGRTVQGRVIPAQRAGAGRASTPRPLPGPPPFTQPKTKPRARPGGSGPGPDWRAMRDRVPGTPVHRGNYQAVILAEFVAAIVLVALSPVASKKNPAGLSPYAGQDMIKLGAITGVYFALALVSVGGTGAGRLAAWFGGLILLAVGLGEAATLASILQLGGGSSKNPVTGTTQQGSTIAGRN
jgi:hypothetical protein